MFIILILLVSMFGCVTPRYRYDVVLSKASKTMHCPKNRVSLKKIDEIIYRAEGCGKIAKFHTNYCKYNTSKSNCKIVEVSQTEKSQNKNGKDAKNNSNENKKKLKIKRSEFKKYRKTYSFFLGLEGNTGYSWNDIGVFTNPGFNAGFNFFFHIKFLYWL